MLQIHFRLDPQLVWETQSLSMLMHSYQHATLPTHPRFMCARLIPFTYRLQLSMEKVHLCTNGVATHWQQEVCVEYLQLLKTPPTWVYLHRLWPKVLPITSRWTCGKTQFSKERAQLELKLWVQHRLHLLFQWLTKQTHGIILIPQVIKQFNATNSLRWMLPFLMTGKYWIRQQKPMYTNLDRQSEATVNRETCWILIRIH